MRIESIYLGDTCNCIQICHFGRKIGGFKARNFVLKRNLRP